MNAEIKTGIIFGGLIAAGVVFLAILFIGLDESVSIIQDSGIRKAPDLVGISDYLNTSPEKLSKDMENKVILYDIWTYSCVNCIRTLPYITAWDEKYAEQGLLIIGIHSPEFEFEKNAENVQVAMDKYGIDYPVVLDNDMKTWKAFENNYWPRKYIADHQGNLRYDHIGEGGYQETEKIIQQLLEERSKAMKIEAMSSTSLVSIEEFEHTLFRTPELYFGYKFAQNRNQLGSEE
ncbi:MAG: redoxin family protein, partial [Nitrosopumilus sp.]|nr:redoxin family protein [Nitrosopumilus sp.]